LFGASWAENGTIFFTHRFSGIAKVPAGGGKPTLLTMPDVNGGEQHVLPHPVAGGKAVLFTIVNKFDWEKAQVVVQSLETSERRVLLEGGADARYFPTGYLLYMKSGTLMAVRFDERQLRLSGDPVALLPDVMQAINQPFDGDESGAGQWTFSSSG